MKDAILLALVAAVSIAFWWAVVTFGWLDDILIGFAVVVVVGALILRLAEGDGR